MGYPPVLWALALFFLGLGFTARFDLPLAVLAVTASFAFGQPGMPAPRTGWREHAVLIGFLLVAVVSTVFSVDWRHSLAVQPQLLPALLCYAVIASFVRGEQQVRFVMVSLMISGLLTAGLMLAGGAVASGVDPLSQVKTFGNALLVVPNDLLMLSVMAPLVSAVAWYGGLTVRLLAVAYLALALISGVLLQSRQAVVLLILGQALLVLLLRPRWAVPLLLVGTAIGVLADGLLGWPLASKIFMFPRTYVWHSAWLMFLDSPWVGQGPGMFKDLYFAFLERAGYDIAALGDRRTMPWAHSLYLEQLAERGVPGLLALLALLGSALQRAGRAWQSAPSPEWASLAAGVLSALGVMVAAGVAEATLSRLWVTVLLLVLLALSRALPVRQFTHHSV